MSESAIELQNLTVRAGRKTILTVHELNVSQGEVFGVIGPNGAGKSTLLKACLGLARPSGGAVRILGERPSLMNWFMLARLRRRIGYVAQALAGHSEMPLTTREVVAIGRTGQAGLFRRLKRDDWRLVDSWLDRLGLNNLKHQAYSDLSGGEQRKTLIARAMVQEPELLMLDEPTANLDLGWREQIVQTLDQLYNETGVTIVLICHEMEVLPPCCRRLALLEQGQLSTIGSPEEVLDTERVQRLYGPGVNVVHHGHRHAVVPAPSAERTGT
jgi:ABC-type cobalamin/Fe3+-siderophores transport system ATPase subunit